MILRMGRALLSLLVPLTGTRATAGTVRLTATSDPVALTATTPLHLCPVLGGQLRPELVFETVGAATVGPAGTEVPIRALLGGTYGNTLPAGCDLALLPPVDGLEPRGSVVTPPAGGAKAEGWRTLAMARLIQELRQARIPEDLVRGGLTDLPAVALAWAGLTRYTGGPARPARNERRYTHRWAVFIITAQKTGNAVRNLEGLDLVPAVLDLMEDATSTDTGERIASKGLEVESVRPLVIAPGVTAHVVTFQAVAIHSVDGLRRRGAPAPWLETYFAMPTDEDTAHPDTLRPVDIAWDQP